MNYSKRCLFDEIDDINSKLNKQTKEPKRRKTIIEPKRATEEEINEYEENKYRGILKKEDVKLRNRQRAAVKVLCECGRIVRRGYITGHRQTQMHFKKLQNSLNGKTQ